MQEYNIITVENDESFVTIETLVKFSGNEEEAIKSLIRKYQTKLEAKQISNSVLNVNLKLLPAGVSGNINWAKVKLNERQATFLLTLMGNSEKVVEFKDNLETEFYSYRSKIKPLTQIETLQVIVNSMVEHEQKISKAQSTAANALGLAEKHDYIIENNKSQEIRPQKGFYSKKTLADKMAHKFPKAHSQAILVDPATVKRIRSHQCKTYVEATLSYEEYVVYNLEDTSDLIDDLIATGIRVLNKTGEPSTKVKSPLYGQSFKQPI